MLNWNWIEADLNESLSSVRLAWLIRERSCWCQALLFEVEEWKFDAGDYFLP